MLDVLPTAQPAALKQQRHITDYKQ